MTFWGFWERERERRKSSDMGQNCQWFGEEEKKKVCDAEGK
jgi:hypothetical protein